MTDLQGKPYADLPNAYRSQKGYVADCTCRGNPWDPQEVARHQAYADADTARKSAAGEVKTSAVGRRQERAVADSRQPEKD